MKKIILTLSFMFSTMMCFSQNIGDVLSIDTLPLFPSLVAEFNYIKYDSAYVILYDDDLDEFTEEEYYEYRDYVVIECDEKDFFDFICTFHNFDLDDITYSCQTFFIKEVVTMVDGGENYRYFLIQDKRELR